MWSFKKAEFQALPIKEENSQSDDSSESEAMLDHDYRKYDSRSRLRQACSSNIPWIFTTAALSLYILIFASGPHAKGVPWTSTDVGNFLSNEEWRKSGAKSKVYIRNLMKESTTRFTSGLDYNNSNHSLQHTPSEGLRFIGTPNRELDSAWDEIAGSKSFLADFPVLSSVDFHCSARNILDKGRGDFDVGWRYVYFSTNRPSCCRVSSRPCLF